MLWDEQLQPPRAGDRLTPLSRASLRLCRADAGGLEQKDGSVRTTATSAAELRAAGRRLDASFHASDGVRALHHLHRWSANARPLDQLHETPAVYTADPSLDPAALLQHARRLDPLGQVCRKGGIFIGGRARRIYVTDPERGVPFLSSSDMLMASFEGVKLISKRQPGLSSMLLCEGWTLISRSGTIGNTAYARADMAGIAGSEHIMRVIPDSDVILPGYVYGFLSSSIGHAILKSGTFGSVVDTIEPEFVGSIPIPRLEPTTEQRIHDLIEEAARLRVEANRLLVDVQQQLASAIGPLPNHDKTENFGFVVSKSSISRLTGFSNKPSSRLAREIVQQAPQAIPLRDATLRIFHPFRMNMVYVSADRGVPFLNLSDMLGNRYRTANYMSSRTQGFNDYLLQYGWTLVSRDGTVGKVSFVGKYLEGTATNQHISRVIPNTEVLPAGYLYAFMASPYARLQIDSLIYGSVILGVYEKDLGTILVPLIEQTTMQMLGARVEQAFDLRYQANQHEDTAQALLAEALELSEWT